MSTIDLDSESDKRPLIFKLIKEKYGYDRVLNIVTFKTLKPKASILTAGRGLGYNNDEIQSIADIIPVERGQQWSLDECIHGNEDLDRKPIKEFVNLISQYEGLLESALDLEGLIVGRSIHASGLYIFNDHFINQNSLMKAPNGEDVTCWNMEDSDYCGALKVDELTIEALDKIRTCMDLLIKENKMEWKGTLRDTYNEYLHPDKLIYENENMYKLLYNGDVINAFQYEGNVGEQALNKLKPNKFTELIAGNSLMRLSTKGKEEQPLDKYVRFKKDISLWYEEMQHYGLNDNEVKVLEKHLKHLYGVADTQEVVMLLSMDENISNFTLTEANKLRKGIAKKKKKLLQECKDLFFSKGLSIGTRKQLLDYVWIEQIEPQLGYSFSINHTTPYSGILIQEMNLAYLFGDMYWKCACLTVNAGAIGEGKTTNYGKIAKAICEMNNIVDYPSINYSEEGFTIHKNKILFGLKAITSVGEADIELIKANRPYTSFEDFMNKTGNSLGDGTITNLIKSNAFSEFEDRIILMNHYLNSICNYKTSFTLSNIPSLMELGFIDKTKYNQELKIYYLYKNIATKSNTIKIDDKRGEWCKISNELLDYFLQEIGEYLKEEVDYFYYQDCYVVKKSKIKSFLDETIQKKLSTNILKNKEVIEEYNKLIYQQIKDKYAKGNESQWEMNSMNYYKGKHELENVDTNRYSITNFFELPSDPVVNETWTSKNGRVFKRYKLSLIMGTVLDRNKDKHTIDLLTPQGVVTLKYYSGLFNHYNKTISKVVDEKGKKVKKRIEESWFKRGSKILVYGFRNGDNFFPRKYKNSIFEHTTMKIQDINTDGTIQVQFERYKESES